MQHTRSLGLSDLLSDLVSVYGCPPTEMSCHDGVRLLSALRYSVVLFPYLGVVTVDMKSSQLLRRVGAVGLAAAAVPCSNPSTQGPGDQSSAPPPPTAQSAAKAIKAAVPEITRLIPLTETNDSNNLLGRPGGYTTAVVLVDPRSGRPVRSGQAGRKRLVRRKPHVRLSADATDWQHSPPAATR